MEELIRIRQKKDGSSAVSARELHGFLESRQQFGNWIQNRIEKYGFVEGRDFTSFNEIIKRESGATTRKEYALTLNMAKELSMVENNERGRQARKYFITCEERLKEQPQIKDPQIAAMMLTLRELDLVKQEQERAARERERIQQEQDRQSKEMAKLQENVAVIEARTQPENCHYTVMGWANLQGIRLPIGRASKLGRLCAEESRERGIPIGDVSDPRFGRVHSYHDSILETVFENTFAGVLPD